MPIRTEPIVDAEGQVTAMRMIVECDVCANVFNPAERSWDMIGREAVCLRCQRERDLATQADPESASVERNGVLAGAAWITGNATYPSIYNQPSSLNVDTTLAEEAMRQFGEALRTAQLRISNALRFDLPTVQWTSDITAPDFGLPTKNNDPLTADEITAVNTAQLRPEPTRCLRARRHALPLARPDGLWCAECKTILMSPADTRNRFINGAAVAVPAGGYP